MTTISTAEMTTGSVLSKDGTRIGYLRAMGPDYWLRRFPDHEQA